MLMLLQTAVILLCGFTVSVHSDITTEENSRVFGNTESQMKAMKNYNCLKLTEEDVARYKAQIKEDKPKIAKLMQRQDAPDQFDWREKNPEYITPVGSQGMCGSCWAFAFAGQLESHYAIQHKTKAELLSKSELVECASRWCGGANFYHAYYYSEKNGLLPEQEYPYRNEDGNVESCKRVDFGFNETLVKPVNFTELGRSYLALGNHLEIKNLLYQYGPVFGAVNPYLFSNNNFDIIRKDDVNCSPEGINHAVLLVGYGVENDVPYWIIKNSWGLYSGKGGFLRMERGSNTCGIEQMAFQLLLTN